MSNLQNKKINLISKPAKPPFSTHTHTCNS